MSNAYGGSSLFYLTRRSRAHDRRQRMVQAKHGGTVLLHASTQGLCNLHHHMLHHRTTLHKSSRRAYRSQGARRSRSRKTPPPSIERPFQVYLTQRTIQLKRRHSNRNTIPSAAPDRPTPARYKSSPQHPHATLQANVNPPPHSHSIHRRQLLRLAQRRARAPGEDLDSYHVRAIYAALGVSGIRGTAMKMTWSCKTGEQQQSYSAAAF